MSTLDAVRPQRARPWWERTGPGLAVAAGGAAAAMAVNRLVPALSALTVAVLIGVVVGGALPAVTADGLQWATRTLLRAGVVLLGLQLSLTEVVRLGPGMLAVVAATVVLAFAGTLGLARLTGVPRGLGLMVATGFSICGASAIVAMDSVARARKEDVATAVTLVTIYGSAAIAVVPFLGGRVLGLDPETLGMWAGLSVHEVAQVVAAASPAGAAAVGTAVIVKLTRVVLLAPMVAGMGVVERRAGGAAGGRRPPIVPLFVAGFLVMLLLRSAGAVPVPVLAGAKEVSTVLLAAAMFGLGTSVRVRSLLRTGRRGLLLGLLSTALVGAISLAALSLLGHR
ncbi:YeiH family protein [Actinomadura bangladeshensis]|uniref:Putative sulfate exporter family transporter n=1 Tax=Actinomadura bangladeshensis TaxID=453573 RepID=A0A6L9QS16_9ACTN|nr:putative sulfate exporter family transporter [Actinomadura bangladeshensis]NEA28241.1 putative sulfate exporter family transporter [Actinomadura bangladeshensis]